MRIYLRLKHIKLGPKLQSLQLLFPLDCSKQTFSHIFIDPCDSLKFIIPGCEILIFRVMQGLQTGVFKQILQLKQGIRQFTRGYADIDHGK